MRTKREIHQLLFFLFFFSSPFSLIFSTCSVHSFLSLQLHSWFSFLVSFPLLFLPYFLSPSILPSQCFTCFLLIFLFSLLSLFPLLILFPLLDFSPLLISPCLLVSSLLFHFLFLYSPFFSVPLVLFTSSTFLFSFPYFIPFVLSSPLLFPPHS